jgi:5-methylcytosine-specific restriction endonuclease McrA
VKVPQWLLAQELENYYCNADCRREWAREDVEGGGNRRPPVSAKAASTRQRGANWRVQSKAARERDRYSCRVCGVSEEELGKRLHVHHTIPYSRFKSNIEANRLDYLVSVCSSCHGQLEAQLRKDLPLFADMDPSTTHEHRADGVDPADHGDDRRQIQGGN